MGTLPTIVMYHYVRDLENSRVPGIKARTVEEFEHQLDYIEANFTVIGVEALIAGVQPGGQIPERSAVLTFDDGYLEHFTMVFPILKRRGLTGLFFPPAKCIEQRNVLDVNKIHFALACEADHKKMAAQLTGWIDAHAQDHGLPDAGSLHETYAKPSHLDPAETVFIKRVLQKGLPYAARAKAVDWLFATFGDVSESVLAQELYVTMDQLKVMIDNGMYVGSHGYEHLWLDTISVEDQQTEVDLSLQFLSDLGAPTRDWVMCYPYGGWNDDLLNVLRQRQCAAGLTIRVDRDGINDPLVLPRVDTNALPFAAA